ncbi:MAG: 2-dehydropantoate 2-reductase [candidate division NC10 bacterium]|jgi:2-dehydropantoate 2-reductase|nr:2-dehydropantoate 2-reductase [candidate division NC10 bacterium]
MAITVWGAGAIGGITGGALTRAGHDVLLVDAHEEHVGALQRDGLTVEDTRGDWHVPVKAATPAAVRGPLDLVLLAVKAHATPTALDQIIPHLTRTSVVVSVQNGLNEEAIAERIGAARTVGCLVNWAADWIAPGRVQFGGTGSFMVGELDGALTPRVRDLAALLSAVMPSGVSDNIWGCLWAKVCLAALLFATALTDETVYDVVERPFPAQRTLVLLVAEAMAVAEASGVRLVAFDEYDPALYRKGAAGDRVAIEEAMATVARFYRRHTKVKTGVWRDLAVRKRKTEVDSQLGVVAAKARRLGIPTPLLDRVIAMIHDLESGRREMGWSNLDELIALT